MSPPAPLLASALLALAAPSGGAPVRPAAPPPPSIAWAVLKAPLPKATPAACKAVAAGAQAVRAPLFGVEGAACPVARVGDDLIPLGEAREALTAPHLAQGADAKGRGLAAELDRSVRRLVEIRLVAAEAGEMGLLDLPEPRAAIEEHATLTLRALLERQVKEGAAPDREEVEKLHRLGVRELHLRSLLFPRKADAEAFRAALAGGEPFDAAAARELAAKRAQGTGTPDWIRIANLLPPVRPVAAELAPGRPTPVVDVGGQFVVAVQDGERFPEDAEVRRAATQASLDRQRQLRLDAWFDALAKAHATVDEKLLEGLDFEAPSPGFAALRKDVRPIAQLDDGTALTVGALAEAIGRKFFHGTEQPAKERRVNVAKRDQFLQLLRERLATREFDARRLREHPDFVREMVEYRRAVAFSTFLEKVLVPGVKVGEAEVKQAYEARRGEFTTPGLFRLEGLSFTGEADARAAAEQLRKGTDLAWLRANAGGRVNADDAKLELDGRPLSVPSLPPPLAKALAGAKAGDVRLLADGGQHHVIRVVSETPPAVQPYPEAREAVARALFAERLERSLHEYAARLKQATRTEILLVRIDRG
jgi:hypothetical protein